ncbi:MAG: hypothetical protein V4685_17610 [Bacteroidota bacterium]
MNLQHTSNKMLSQLSIAPVCNTATGRTMGSWIYENKDFDNKKYWPGWHLM